jgi:hypothetical protein
VKDRLGAILVSIFRKRYEETPRSSHALSIRCKVLRKQSLDFFAIGYRALAIGTNLLLHCYPCDPGAEQNDSRPYQAARETLVRGHDAPKPLWKLPLTRASAPDLGKRQD